ncbi:MAG: serine/threonine protein kinase [Planctomycetes bacterium]|nr:serine/threonine protein kinase [Planctomycetota bacterium]MCB9917340.1 serine/threonine protein kinase [Planctomycetota bacterium]
MNRIAGKKFGKYELSDDVLGQGGCAIVYRARHVDLGDDVAIKLMPAPRGEDDRPRYERFVDEAKKLRDLGKAHRHIVRIEDFGEVGDAVYVAMELAHGCLKNRLERDGRLRIDEAVGITEQIGEALHAAHEKGIVHRDVKPANILFRENGEPVLTDFGIAKELGQDLGLTTDKQVLGTPLYMSPEQSIGSRRLDARSDQFSLAIVLFEMLCGQRPFRGTSTEELVRKIRTTKPPMPRSLRCDVPEALEAVLMRALHKNPRKRYSSTLDFVRAARDAIRIDATSDGLSKTWGAERTKTRALAWSLPIGGSLFAVAGLAMLLLGTSKVGSKSLPVHRDQIIPKRDSDDQDKHITKHDLDAAHWSPKKSSLRVRVDVAAENGGGSEELLAPLRDAAERALAVEYRVLDTKSPIAISKPDFFVRVSLHTGVEEPRLDRYRARVSWAIEIYSAATDSIVTHDSGEHTGAMQLSERGALKAAFGSASDDLVRRIGTAIQLAYERLREHGRLVRIGFLARNPIPDLATWFEGVLRDGVSLQSLRTIVADGERYSVQLRDAMERTGVYLPRLGDDEIDEIGEPAHESVLDSVSLRIVYQTKDGSSNALVEPIRQCAGLAEGGVHFAPMRSFVNSGEIEPPLAHGMEIRYAIADERAYEAARQVRAALMAREELASRDPVLRGIEAEGPDWAETPEGKRRLVVVIADVLDDDYGFDVDDDPYLLPPESEKQNLVVMLFEGRYRGDVGLLRRALLQRIVSHVQKHDARCKDSGVPVMARVAGDEALMFVVDDPR